MVPVLLGFLVLLVLVVLLRLIVDRMRLLLWLVVAVLVGAGVPGVVLGVLFLCLRVGR